MLYGYSTMSSHSEFVDYLLERLAPLGDMRARHMFGGYGIYCGERMFALVEHDTLYFKADDRTRGEFEALGLPPFTYLRQNRECALSYFMAPAEVLEEEDCLREWVDKALGAATRAASGGMRARR